MPELPEVETICQRLQDLLEGEVIREIRVLDPTCIQGGDASHVARSLAGSRVEKIGRRGKYLIFDLEPPARLIVHLGMTGSIIKDSADTGRHRLTICTESATLAFHDVRRLGRVWICSSSPDDLPPGLRRLGPEPFDRCLDASRFHRRLNRTRSSLKAVLLGQRVIAGLGNIYVDEALWESGLHPSRRASSLTEEESAGLLEAIRRVLVRALEAGGTTFSDYRTPDNTSGSFQRQLKVYGRKGQSCNRCRHTIERMVVAGRGTHYCPYCQREQT